MIIVKVELHSANTGQVTELARMDICNEGTMTIPSKGNYVAMTFRGRSKEALARRTVMKSTHLLNWPREAYHVWNLVCKMLIQMGYTQGH